MDFPKEIRFTNIYAFKTFRDIIEKELPNCKWSAGTHLYVWTPPSWAFPLTISVDGNNLRIEGFEGHR